MSKTVSIPLKIDLLVRLEILLQPAWLLPHDPSRCSSTVRILAKKRPSSQITIVVPIKQKMVRKRQVIQKCPFLDPL
jgi:hypothetical protein